MSNRWIYDKVNRLIKKHKTRDPSELIPAMNIKLEYLHDAKHLLGMYTVIQRNRFIFISDNVGKNKNTILAHELGHDQLHRDHCKDGAFFQENKLFNPTNKLETQASIFAAHLLISDEDILNNLGEESCDYGLAAELGVDINLLNLKISEMAKMGLLDYRVRVEKPRSDFLKKYRPEEEIYE